MRINRTFGGLSGTYCSCLASGRRKYPLDNRAAFVSCVVVMTTAALDLSFTHTHILACICILQREMYICVARFSVSSKYWVGFNVHNAFLGNCVGGPFGGRLIPPFQISNYISSRFKKQTTQWRYMLNNIWYCQIFISGAAPTVFLVASWLPTQSPQQM